MMNTGVKGLMCQMVMSTKEKDEAGREAECAGVRKEACGLTWGWQRGLSEGGHADKELKALKEEALRVPGGGVRAKSVESCVHCFHRVCTHPVLAACVCACARSRVFV